MAEYFKREAELGRTLMPLHSYQKRAAAATGVSTATLRKLEGARREIRSEKVAAECVRSSHFAWKRACSWRCLQLIVYNCTSPVFHFTVDVIHHSYWTQSQIILT